MAAQHPVLIILAGGASSRMWPLREKSLIKFGKVPLLQMQLENYATLGFQEAIIVGNPENVDDMRGIVGQMKSDMTIEVAVQPEPKGMGDALLKAADFFVDRPDTPIYITQVHDVTDKSLHESILAAYQAEPETTFLAGVEMEDYFPGGYLIVDEAGKISGMVEKPGAENRPSNLVNIVAHIHAHVGRLFDAIRAEYASDTPGDDHYERAMDALMKTHMYRVVPYSGHWSALKFPWHTLDIMDYFLSKIEGQTVHESAFVASTASLVGNVFVDEGSKIFPGAAIVGPAYVGKDVIVGNNALIRNSMVLDRCQVGFTTEVARSYVAADCNMHACRVLDSIFAPGVNFSAGCTTANLRIDKGIVKSTVKGQRIASGRDKLGAIIGENAFLGVDVMTMPGIKVGASAEVGPGTHVLEDIRENMRVYVKQELGIIEKKQ